MSMEELPPFEIQLTCFDIMERETRAVNIPNSERTMSLTVRAASLAIVSIALTRPVAAQSDPALRAPSAPTAQTTERRSCFRRRLPRPSRTDSSTRCSATSRRSGR